MNLGPLAKGRHGVNWQSPQSAGCLQKAEIILSLDIVRRRLQLRMLYPQNMKHIHNKLRCDYNACTSNASRKERYWKIETMHVGVKILDQHGRTSDWDITQWLPSPTVNDSRKVSVSEVRQNDSAFRMNTSSRKVLREVLSGILITELNMRRSRIRRRRCRRTQRVLGRSCLTPRCHRQD